MKLQSIKSELQSFDTWKAQEMVKLVLLLVIVVTVIVSVEDKSMTTRKYKYCKCHYAEFTNEDTEGQRSPVTCPKS